MKYSRGTLSDFIEFNPRESLPKGNVAKEIAMADLIPFQKKISNYIISPYKGGMKFRNGDTLLARITPCLENGKTAYVDILNEDEVGFGSTEYIVLRAIPQKTIPEFVFYFAISDWFRKRAIALMTGSSGRQRVQTDKLMDLKVIMPDLEAQKKIVRILSALDQKIELNIQKNETFNTTCGLLLKKYLSQQESENHTIGEFLNVFTGKRNANETNIDGKYVFFSCAPESLKADTYIYDGAAIIIAGNGAYTGRTRFYEGKMELYQRTYACTPKDETDHSIYGFYTYMKNIFEKEIMGGTHGSAIPYIVMGDITNYKIPYDISSFNVFSKQVAPFIKAIQKNEEENTKLANLRDTLLPKLLSGEIDLEKVKI